MKRWQSISAILLGALAVSGCFQTSEKLYSCRGVQTSYQTEFKFRTFKFDDFSLILKEKFSPSALIKGEKLYTIEGNTFPMTGETNDYKIFAENEDFDSRFIFNLITKKMSYSDKNSYGRTDFYEGRCVASEV